MLRGNMLRKVDRNAVPHWLVTSRSALTSRSGMDSISQVLGEKSYHTIVSGWQQGNWVSLVGEPGFIQIVDGNSKVLRKIDDSDAPHWMVLDDKSVAVRSAMDTHSATLG